MRLLVTGALGHIGSRFIRGLRPGDWESVVLLDDLSTQRYGSLFNLPESVPFHFVEGDVCTADLGRYFEGVDFVIHLAAITDAPATFDKKEEVERVNCEGTRKVAEGCRSSGCKLVFISTTSVYGSQNEIMDEDCPDDELKAQSPYAESKLWAERMIQSLGEKDGLQFVICRFGTIFGPSVGMRFHTAVNKFTWQACLGEPITVWRTALHQKRPYLDLGDATRALDFIVKTNRFDNQIYNVVTTNATVDNIVNILRSHVTALKVQLVDSEIMNQLSYQVSCEKFQALGFRFQGSLEKGIGDTVSLIRNVHPA